MKSALFAFIILFATHIYQVSSSGETCGDCLANFTDCVIEQFSDDGCCTCVTELKDCFNSLACNTTEETSFLHDVCEFYMCGDCFQHGTKIKNGIHFHLLYYFHLILSTKLKN